MTTSFTFDVHPRDLGKYELKLAGSLRMEQQKYLRRVGDRCLAILQAASSFIRDTGAFQAGWKKRALFTTLEVYNDCDWAIYVEAGRQPGIAPPSWALVGWAGRKLGDPGLAFVVARAIGRRGIEARPVLSNPSVQAEMSAVVVQELTTLWMSWVTGAR